MCTSWRVERLVAWLCEGLKALVWCLALAACVFGAKNRIIHLLAICVFSLFFIFLEWQLARARCFVPTGVWKALFRDSASVLNAFWQARSVVACVSVFRGEIFYGCRPMIFPGFFWRRLARPRFVYQLASGKPCSWLWLGFRLRSCNVTNYWHPKSYEKSHRNEIY